MIQYNFPCDNNKLINFVNGDKVIESKVGNSLVMVRINKTTWKVIKFQTKNDGNVYLTDGDKEVLANDVYNAG
jgi:hypothetical protein